ncbi:MAG: hypothetical protein ACODAB_05435 [Gemmatimonadota bacterium]
MAKLHDLRLRHVVWWQEIRTTLWPAIQRARQDTFFARLAREITDNDRLPPTLQRALVQASMANPPVSSVQKLASVVGCSPDTLQHHWRATGAADHLRLKDALSWILLLRACVTKCEARSWSHVAKALSVSERTLSRTAKRLTGMQLARLAADGEHTTALRRFGRLPLGVLGREDSPFCGWIRSFDLAGG